MTKYRVQGPDGQTHEFEGPEGAKPEEVLAAAQAQFGQSEGAQPQAPQPSPEEQAFASGRQAGNDENPALAATSQAAMQGTFGLQNYINAGFRTAAGNGSFKDNLAYSRGKSEGEAEGHPIAATIGGTAGTVMSGAAILKAAKALPGGAAVSRFLAPKAGKAVGNVAKAALAGGAAGGAIAANEGQPLPQVAQTAALSAAAAPVAGKVLGYALNKLQPTAQRAMQTLADNIGETPKVLQDAYDSFLKVTGRLPSMAEIVGLKSQGKLRQLAAANSTVGDAAVKAANAAGAPLHEQLAAAQAQQANYPQTVNGIHELRDAETDAAMNTPHPQTGVLLKDAPVPDPKGILTSPYVLHALQPNAQINARLNQASPVLVRAQTNTATIGDLDVIRKALRDMQNTYARPAPGSAHMRDAATAKEFGDVANKVEGLGTSADPDYGLVLDNYRQHSRYADAFMHGLKGKAFGDVPEGDTMLAAALKTSSGAKGYEHGNALANAQSVLSSIAPGSVRPEAAAVTPSHVAQGAMAASSGGISAVYHAMRAIPGMHLPDSVQQVIAKQLFNPATAQQGINNLRRAGIDAQHIRELSAAVGLSTGAHVGQHLSRQGQ